MFTVTHDGHGTAEAHDTSPARCMIAPSRRLGPNATEASARRLRRGLRARASPAAGAVIRRVSASAVNGASAIGEPGAGPSDKLGTRHAAVSGAVADEVPAEANRESRPMTGQIPRIKGLVIQPVGKCPDRC